MVIQQRISNLQAMIQDGHQAFISYSYSEVSGKLKTKITVSAAKDVVPKCMRPSLLMAVTPLLELSCLHVTVDRGHSFSAGHCVANFWFSPHSDTTTDEQIYDASGVSLEATGAASKATAGIRTGDATARHEDNGCTGTVAPPPLKRVRFSLQDEVAFCSAGTSALQSLEEFLADVPAIAPASTCLTSAKAELSATILESFTCLRDNSRGLQNCVTESQPFLPNAKYHDLTVRCAYLARKMDATFVLLESVPDDYKKLRMEFDDNFDALAEIYGGIKYDFEICIETARTARDTQPALYSESLMRVRDG